MNIHELEHLEVLANVLGDDALKSLNQFCRIVDQVDHILKLSYSSITEGKRTVIKRSDVNLLERASVDIAEVIERLNKYTKEDPIGFMKPSGDQSLDYLKLSTYMTLKQTIKHVVAHHRSLNNILMMINSGICSPLIAIDEES